MNILDYWEETKQELLAFPHLTKSSTKSWQYLWDLRDKTWKGFAAIEEHKGIVKPRISLSTTHGQEVTRVILFRILEEGAESLLAEDRHHHLEELIDAINYLMSMFLVDDERKNWWELNVIMNTATEQVSWDEEFNLESLGNCSLLLGGVLSDKLRNRAWMHNSQDFYFSGRKIFNSVLGQVFGELVSPFKHFEEFVTYFIAKDKVLQFRLESNY